MNQYFDIIRGIPNLSNFNRRGIGPGHSDHGGTPLQTSYTPETIGIEVINQAGMTAPV